MKSKSRILFTTACFGSLLTLSVLFSGCNSAPPTPNNEIDTFPVSGVIHVNGKPEKGVVIVMNYTPVRQGDETVPPTPTGKTDETGSFKIKTYRTDDGAPAGDYIATITWPDGGVFQINTGDYTPTDWLDGKYSNVKTSKFKYTVKEGSESNELPTIEVEAPERDK